MAFITQDTTMDEASSIAPSFITTNDEDPYASGNAISVVYAGTR